MKKEYACFNVCDINAKYSDGETVDKTTLVEKGLLKGSVLSVKILANGEITKKLTFNVDKVSASAKAKIEAAGGTVNLISTEKKE